MTGLLADGDRTSARQMVTFLFDRAQQPDGSFPRDSLVNGAPAPDLFGLSEIDEVAYPLLMAWQTGFAGDTSFYKAHIRPAADYIVDHGPSTGAERWEEHPGYSPADDRRRDRRVWWRPRTWPPLPTTPGVPACTWPRPTTTSATSSAGRSPQRARTRRAATSSASRAAATRTPLRPMTSATAASRRVDQRRIIDAGFLELTRLGELSASDSDVKASLGVVDSVLREPDPIRSRLAPLRDPGQRRHRRLRRLLRA